MAESEGVSGQLFEAYLQAFAEHKPDEYKIVVMDNAAFHSTKHIKIPDNIGIINIPLYSPGLNPCEQVWQYIKARFSKLVFTDIASVKQWLYEHACTLPKEKIKSITSNHHYLEAFNATCNC